LQEKIHAHFFDLYETICHNDSIHYILTKIHMASLNLDALKKKAPESSENIIQDTATATITETPTSS